MILRRPTRAASRAFDLSRAHGVPASVITRTESRRRWLQLSLATAIAVHAVIMVAPLPSLVSHEAQPVDRKQRIYVVKQVKFKEPPRPEMLAIPKPMTRAVPIPDPTPEFVSADMMIALPAPPPAPPVRWAPGFNTTSHPVFADNSWLRAAEQPVSTFSIDVDSASAAQVRQYLKRGQLPPPGSVRTEEMINAFVYADAPPSGSDPFAVHLAVADCPWQPGHLLARVALKGRVFTEDERPPANLVFLVDVSGSMRDANKLPLVRQALATLVDRSLRADDRVGIVVYAGSAGVVLPTTSGAERGVLREAIGRLEAGGNTNGAAGIRGAYDLARQSWVEGGINRVILVTDGDFNVGVTSNDELVRLVQDQAASGIFLTVLGVGQGNYKDDRLEQLADRGNGNYAYLDSMDEARRVLVEQVGGTLHTIAKDVKIQVELNPAEVEAYRLLGYENRMLQRQDFNDDRVDAGDLGAGHSVVALYEIVPAGSEAPAVASDDLRYQAPALSAAADTGELFTVKLRYKEPDGEHSRLLERRLHLADLGPLSPDFSFAAGTALFAMILRDSDHHGQGTLEHVAQLLYAGIDRGQRHRRELANLVAVARPLIERREARHSG